MVVDGVGSPDPKLDVLPPEVHPLEKLPPLCESHEEAGRDEDDRPLPGNRRVLEHNVVDDGDVYLRM